MAGKWRDLAPRVASAAVLVVLALGAAWAGLTVWALLVAVACGLMTWELSRLHGAGDSAAALPGLLVTGAVLPMLGPVGAVQVVLLVVAALAGLAVVSRDRLVQVLYTAAILATGLLAIWLYRDAQRMLVFLLLVVIVTDIMGYFVGKLMGGPKFWPRISPKKTWSGTIGGWVGAGVVGAAFASDGWFVVPLAVLMSFAAQMGDIAESAMKRRADVKDSSGLIPGHGGVMDRFDGIVGASAVLFLVFLTGLFGAAP
ncbi:phosphatidate cytidylyltransferase [Mesobacterium pallidum]|uniref:phosphatidate cytidylyltransferase n=1 Tax=Mesobacterium pallidum TaxID=2872037 RepID=UPI001EE173D8|nr:phosphatidate cytidylyltransferase [Mesobacterium pallidum]